MGADNDASSPPREFDDFETSVDDITRHIFTRDSNDNVQAFPLLPHNIILFYLREGIQF